MRTTWYERLPMRDGDLITGITGFTITRGVLPDYSDAGWEPAPGIIGLPASDAFYAFEMLDGSTVILQEGEVVESKICDLEDFHFKIPSAYSAYNPQYTISGRAVLSHAFIPPSHAVFEYLDRVCVMTNMGLGLKEMASLHARKEGYEEMVKNLKAKFGDAFDINKLKEISDDDGLSVFHYDVD